MSRKYDEGNVALAVMAFTILIMSAIFVGSLVYSLRQDYRAPVVAFTRAEALNSPVRTTEVLVVRVWRDKVREDCPVTTIRTAVDRKGVVWDLPGLISFEGGPASEEFIDVEYTLQQGMPPGPYDLNVHLIYECDGVGTFHYDQPVVKFWIES